MPDQHIEQKLHLHLGRDNCIFWGRTKRLDFGPPRTHPLSIRAAWGGQEYCSVSGRTLAVDDDNFLVLNHGQIYTTRICAAREVEFLAICFAPKLVEKLHVQGGLSFGVAWDEARVFFDHLHPYERGVSQILRLIRAELRRGVASDAWFEEQLHALLAHMQLYKARVLDQASRLAMVQPATRKRVYHGIALATDFLHTRYADRIGLQMLADVAGISKYQFARLFYLVHGITPIEYLQRKRASVAVRLLQSPGITAQDAATSVGFQERFTLARHMKRWCKTSPREIRSSRCVG